jgi:small multidrug resistance family-3 protein
MSMPFFYAVAALGEIAGCSAFWMWWRLDRSALWLAAHGGVRITASLG